MTFPHLNRRTHLYLGLFLLPWVLLYGVSSIPFSHSAWFEAQDKAKGLPNWKPLFERAYDTPVPEGDELREWGRQLLRETGLLQQFGDKVNFGVYRQGPDQVNIYVYTFSRSVQVKYLPATRRLRAEEKRFRWDHFLTGMHAKGGFEQEGWVNDSWGVVVDLVSLSFLIWIASGLYMWWSLPSLRLWGWVALLAGGASFSLFLWLL
jgi:hypothetical protein